MAGLDISIADLERAVARLGLPAGGGLRTRPTAANWRSARSAAAYTRGDRQHVVVATRGEPACARIRSRGFCARRAERGECGRRWSGGGDPVGAKAARRGYAGADTAVTAALGALQGTMPEGVRIDRVLFRQADFIANRSAMSHAR